MNTAKIKYLVILVLIALCVIYQIMLSFNLLPYFMSGEDITALLVLLIGVFLFLLAATAEKISRAITYMGENISLNISTEVLEDNRVLEKIGTKDACKYLVGIQKYLQNITTMKDLLNKLLVLSVKITHSRRASIMLHDRKKNELYIYKTMGWENREVNLARNMKMKPGEGIAGRVFLDGEPLIVNKEDEKEDFEMKDKYRSTSFISLPLFAGPTIIGVVNLTEKIGEQYSSAELDLLTFIMNEVSLCLHYIQVTSD